MLPMPRKDSRLEQADLYPNDNTAILSMLGRASETKNKSDDERMHIFWRVFGGAIVSVMALIALTLFNNIQGSISEVRNDVAKINEARSDYVRKDEFNSRITTNYERITGVQTIAASHTSAISALKTENDSLREKCVALAADVKTAKEEATKARLELEKNQAADQERKARRDEQHKELEKSLKELATQLQECREKLARFEGQQAKPKETEKK